MMNNDNTVTLDNQQSDLVTDNQQTVSLGDGTAKLAVPPNPADAKVKAATISFGLSEILNKSEGDFFSGLMQGQEDHIRNEAAAAIDYQRSFARTQRILGTGQYIPPAEQQDPKSVFEEGYAGRYMASLAQSAGTDPDAQATVAAGTQNLAYRQYFSNRLGNTVQKYQNQGWFPWGVDQLKSLSGIYNEIKLRGNTDDTFWHGLLGDNLELQRQQIYNLPYAQGKKLFDQTMDRLERDNLGLAVMFGNAMVGQSSIDIEKNNATTIMGVGADLATLGSPILKKMIFRTAVQDAVRSPPGGIATREDISQAAASGVGDVKEAGIQAATKEIERGATGVGASPEEIAIERLPSGLRIDAQAIQSNPGKSGADFANRLSDYFNQLGANFQDALNNLMRLTRTPATVASADLARIAAQSMAGRYAGPNSRVIGWGDRLILQPASNTYHVALDIGTHDGTEFRSPGQAIGAADLEGIQLAEPERKATEFYDDRITELNFNVAEKELQIKTFKPTADTAEANILGKLEGELQQLKDTRRDLVEKRAIGYWKPEDIIPEQDGAVLKKQGLGWVIRRYIPLDETSNIVRDNALKLKGVAVGKGFFRRLVNRGGTEVPYLNDPITGKPSRNVWDNIMAFTNAAGPAKTAENFSWRSPEETLSEVENQWRKIVTHNANKLMEPFIENGKLMEKVLRSDDKEAFKKMLTFLQTDTDPLTKESGRFFRSIPEVEDWYQRYRGKLPSEDFTKGYFAYKANYEMERSLRTMSMARNMYRIGVMQHRIGTPGAGGTKFSDWFHAKALDFKASLPSTDDSVLLNVNGKQYSRSLNGLWNTKHGEEIKDKIKNGELKILQLWNKEDEARPLHKFADSLKTYDSPAYVITDSHEYTPLDYNKLIPRRGGGHWGWEHEFYISQPNIVFNPTTKLYEFKGDTTVMPFRNRALADRIAKHLNIAHDYIVGGNEDAARKHINDLGVAGLDFDKDVLKHYKESWLDGKAIPARFNRNTGFVVRSKDMSTMDLDRSLQDQYPNLRDTTKSSNLAKANAIEFTGRRDAEHLFTVDDKGTPNNPIFSYRPAEMIDPIDMINRSVTRLVNSTLMDDYKYASAEHWLQSAMPYLTASKEEVYHSPFGVFLKAEFKKDAPENVKQILIANRKKIKDFIGTPSAMDTALHSVSSALADSIYGKLGGKALVPLEKIPETGNPIQAMRSLTFHMKLGLGAVPVFFTQATAFSNVMAIAFKQAPAATMGALFHEWARFAPQHIDYMDELASKLHIPGFDRYLKGEWKEAHEMLKNQIGFFEVGREHAMWDTMFKDKAVTSRWDIAKYWGQTAFREGAQFVRAGAWYAAHKEWRAANPTKAMSRLDKASILNRATLLDHNMSRASNSAINSGIMSVPAQFYTYARNLAEMMYGKRLTWQEKSRLFAVNTALWGLPAGGIGLYGFPIGDEIKKDAIDKGYVTGNGLAMSTLMEGGASALGAYITGDGDTAKGTWYDFSKFGVKGYDPINDFLASDKTFMDFVGGASWSVLKNTIKRSSNLWQDLNAMMDPTNNTRFPIKAQDFADLFKEASGFSYPWKVTMAMYSGNWMSNNNTPLEDKVSWGDALFRGITGTVPTAISDIGAVRGILNNRKSYVNYITNQYDRNFNLALVSLKNKDTDGYKDFMKKAQGLVRSQ